MFVRKARIALVIMLFYSSTGSAIDCLAANGVWFSASYKSINKFSADSCQKINDYFIAPDNLESQHLKRYDAQDMQSEQPSLWNSNFRGRVVKIGPLSSSDVVQTRLPQRNKYHSRASIFAEDINFIADMFNIDPLLLHSIAYVESRYNPSAISPAGAKGMMQLMPATARRFGLVGSEEELFDPLVSLRLSSLYLRKLYKLFGNDLTLVLAAYNAGENAVIKYGRKVPPYQETQAYVQKVMAHYLDLRT